MAVHLASFSRIDFNRSVRTAAKGLRTKVASVNRATVPYLGSRLVEFSRRLPSLVRGVTLQTVASLQRPATFRHEGGPAVMLVPGLFCAPGAMNQLGRELEALGLDVHLPRAFPYYRGTLANTGPVERSVQILLEDLEVLATEHDVQEITLVGHSLGGIIALAAAVHAPDSTRILPRAVGILLLAPPLDGTPLAVPLRPFLPAAREISPRAERLRFVRAAMGHITQTFTAGADSLVPLESQEGLAVPTVHFDDFQHMDFFVGTKEQVKRAARAIAESVRSRTSRTEAAAAEAG